MKQAYIQNVQGERAPWPGGGMPTSTSSVNINRSICSMRYLPHLPPVTPPLPHPSPLSRLRSSLALLGVFFSSEPVAASPKRLVMKAPRVADTCSARPYTYKGGGGSGFTAQMPDFSGLHLT